MPLLPRDLVRALDKRLHQPLWCGVPDSRLAPCLSLIDSNRLLVAPREDLAVAAAFGAEIGGRQTVIFMKDAGLGHCIDAILTTFAISSTPIALLISTSTSEVSVPAHHAIWQARLRGILDCLDLHIVEPHDLVRASEAETPDLGFGIAVVVSSGTFGSRQ